MGATQATLISDYLTPMLGSLQRLDVYDEVGKVLPSSIAKFSYKNWVTAETPQVILNRATVTTGYTLDKPNGLITFTAPTINEGDDVFATYIFSYFTSSDLGAFLDLTLADLNNAPPKTGFSYTGAEDNWSYALVDGAYVRALRVLLMDCTTWRARLIFADPTTLINYIQAELSHYQASYLTWRKTLKGRRFITPRTVSSGRWRRPAVPTGANWADFTVVRGGA